MEIKSFCIFLFAFCFFYTAPAQIAAPDHSALKSFVDSKGLSAALVGVYVYDDSSKKIIDNYQSDKFFVPASTTKLFTLYAGLKYLGDSLMGIRYIENDTAIFVCPTGDPSLLHPDYQSQPVFDFLKKTGKKIYIAELGWSEKPWGPGWEWDDLTEDFSAERSALPVYGNFIRWFQENSGKRANTAFEETATVSSSPEISWKVRYSQDNTIKKFQVDRLLDSNVFIIHLTKEKEAQTDVPFITYNLESAIQLLRDTLGKTIQIYQPKNPAEDIRTRWTAAIRLDTLHINSRPVDSVFMPMMHRSDNFFSEQTLLMVSSRMFDQMNDKVVTNGLLQMDLADLPQKPNWVDGSGLSRFNLFTPMDFVSVLIKMKSEFGMDRMKKILPTTGTGTLKYFNPAANGFIFAKTGSMTGVYCLSGYLYTAKKHLLEFSVMINNHNGPNTELRKAVESYVEVLRRQN